MNDIFFKSDIVFRPFFIYVFIFITTSRRFKIWSSWITNRITTSDLKKYIIHEKWIFIRIKIGLYFERLWTTFCLIAVNKKLVNLSKKGRTIKHLDSSNKNLLNNKFFKSDIVILGPSSYTSSALAPPVPRSSRLII